MQAWFAVLTKPRAEALAQEHLSRQGYDCLFPRVRRLLRTAHGVETRVESLFPRYLFLRADPGTTSLAAVRSTRGAVGLVRFGGEPTRVPDAVVDRIRGRIGTGDGFVQLDAPDYLPGERLRVTEGAFGGLEAVFQCVESGGRVRLLLELLGQRREVVLPRAQLALRI